MAESHEAHLGVLTDAERESLERPGLKQRARAIVAATELATKLGLNNDTLEVMIGRLRELDKSHARLAWRTLGDANELLEMLFIDGALVEETPKAITDDIADTVTEQLVEARELSASGFDLKKVRTFYESINRKTQREWLSVPEKVIDTDELMGLIALYAFNHRQPGNVARVVDNLYDTFKPGELDTAAHTTRYNVTKNIAKLLDGLDGEVAEVVSKQKSETVTEPTVPLVEAERGVLSLHVSDIIEQFADPERSSTYRMDRVEKLLDQLRVRGVDTGQLTAEDFSDAVLEQLVTMYTESVTVPHDVLKTNIACVWGYLSGVDMEDLVEWRKATKVDASPQDVHNSRASFLEGVRKSSDLGVRFEVTEEPTDLEDEGEEFEVYVPPAEPLHSVPPLEEVSDAEEVPVRQERSLDEEPMHVQLATAYTDRLGLADVNMRAFEELLNPNTHGEFTPAKKVILERLKQRIGMVSHDGGIINQLDVTPRGKNAVRQLFGMGFMKHGYVVERDSVLLKDQLRNIAPNDRQGYIDDFYTGFGALLDELVTPEEEELTGNAPFRVVIGDDGEARLA